MSRNVLASASQRTSPVCLFLTLLLLAGSPSARAQTPESGQLLAIRASATDPFLYDSDGRVRFFHGLNAIEKDYPWYPQWVDQDYIETVQDLGLNVIRLGWMWSGFEPQKGQFRDAYYNNQLAIVDALAEAGVHTLLDVHQDCLSSEFCSYNGVPAWLLENFEPENPFPWPFPKDSSCGSRSWMMNCMTEAAQQAYQDLYDDVDGMEDAFVQFWTETSKLWAGNTNIIGYELINEPFPGNTYVDPDLLAPGIADHKNLQPFYHQLAQGIRQHDSSHLIFYEPVTWGMIFNGKILGSGFTEVPGGSEYKNRSVLSYHYYCGMFGGNREICDQIVGKQIMSAVREDVAEIGGSTFMTEFGDCGDDLSQCVGAMDLADQYLQSWMLWPGTKQGNDGKHGKIEKEYQEILARTYARAVAGTPECMRFDPKTGDFVLRFQIDATIDAPTEIFAPIQKIYGGEIAVEASAGLHASVASAANFVTVSADDTAHGQAGWVRAYRKSQPPKTPFTCQAPADPSSAGSRPRVGS